MAKQVTYLILVLSAFAGSTASAQLMETANVSSRLVNVQQAPARVVVTTSVTATLPELEQGPSGRCVGLSMPISGTTPTVAVPSATRVTMSRPAVQFPSLDD